jgi:hypothetical protein
VAPLLPPSGSATLGGLNMLNDSVVSFLSLYLHFV